MKKLMLAVLIGLMVFATASIAAAEVTVGGSLEMRYDLWNDLDLNKTLNKDSVKFDNSDVKISNGAQTQTFFADRILLNVDAKITEGLEAFVELETGNGDVDASSERAWGVNKAGSDNETVSAVNYQGERLNVRQAWINFMVPGIPVGVKIGHQPLALGHGISLNTQRDGTDAILVYSKPIPELLVAGVYAKVVEGSSTFPMGGTLNLNTNAITSGPSGSEHHDADVWAALANYTFMPGNTVGVNYLFVHDAATAAPGAALHLHNIGVTADGTIAMISYKAEYDYQDINVNANGKNHGVNVSHAGMVGANAKVSIVNVGMEVAYGTGTSSRFNRDGLSGASGITGSINDFARTYHSPYGETSYNYAFLYNDKIGQGPLGSGGGFGFGDGTGGFGLANTGYIKLTAAVNPTDKLGVDMAVLYLNASESMFRDQSRDLGWEVDAHAGYKIYDNLNLDVNGGVFVPGAWYAFKGAGNDTLEIPASALKDDGSLKRDVAYGLETKLTVKF